MVRYKNTFFNAWDFFHLLFFLKDLSLFHPQLAKKILNPKYRGIKGWEYGMLLSSLRLTKGMRVLDVGVGDSVIPYYLASKKDVRVVAFDLPQPFEQPKSAVSHHRVFLGRGTMLALPFGDSVFDVVTCISSIEHLDTGNYRVFLQKTQTAISEMVRVTASKGYLFLTSDLYFPHLEIKDHWDRARDGRVGTAYKSQDVERVFVSAFEKLGCTLVGGVDLNFNQVLRSRARSIYRGRYFTTFCLYVQKNT